MYSLSATSTKRRTIIKALSSEQVTQHINIFTLTMKNEREKSCKVYFFVSQLCWPCLSRLCTNLPADKSTIWLDKQNIHFHFIMLWNYIIVFTKSVKYVHRGWHKWSDVMWNWRICILVYNFLASYCFCYVYFILPVFSPLSHGFTAKICG